MTGERIKETMARLFTTEQEKAEATTQEPEKKKRRRSLVDHDPLPEPAAAEKKTRRSIIDREPLPGATADELKKRRTRKGKPAELRKTHNFTVLMTEQMYQQLKAIAENKGLSMNGIITRLIKKYIVVHDIDQEEDI